MFIRPIHYLLAAAVSLMAVFMIAVAASSVVLIAEAMKVEPEEVAVVEKEKDRSKSGGDGEKTESSSGSQREVVILPPRDRDLDVAVPLAKTWEEAIAAIDQKPKEEESEPGPLVVKQRFDDLAEAIGLAAETTPEDAERISEMDMAAASAKESENPEGEEAPNTEGRDDERLDSLIDSEFAEAELPGAGGQGVVGEPTPPAQVPALAMNAASSASAKAVDDILEIPGLNRIPVSPKENTSDGTKGDEDGDSSEATTDAQESEAKPAVAPAQPSSGGTGDIQRIRRRFNGRSDARGIDSLAARGTEVGKYLSLVSKRVTKNWQRACNDPINGQYITNGMVRVVMEVNPDGTVGDVTVEEAEGVTEVQKNFTADSVKSTPLSAFPESLKAEIGADPIEVVFNFLFFVG